MYVLLGIRSAAALRVVPVVMLLLLLLLIIVHLLPRLTLIQKPLVHIYIYALSSHFYPSGKYIRLLASLVEMLLGFFVCLSVESFNPPPGW